MTRRTTLAADPDDLAVLEGEARRRGVSLARVLRELVGREADEIRRRTRPRFGIARGDGQSIADLMERDPEAPFRSPFRS
jgi:hypothetical protein